MYAQPEAEERERGKAELRGRWWRNKKRTGREKNLVAKQIQ